jgi:hypothetical protein
VLAVCFVEVHAVEAAHGEREDKLAETEYGVGDVAHAHLATPDDSHLECIVCEFGLLVWRVGC